MYLKEFFEKENFGKSQQTTKNHEKLYIIITQHAELNSFLANILEIKTITGLAQA